MTASVAREIIEAAIIRLEGLDLINGNEIFVEENVPATTKDKSFTIHWNEGTLDLDSPGVNRRATIERNLEIQIFRKALKTASGDKQKNVLLDMYDKEQEVFANIMTTRLTTKVRFEQLVSTTVETTELGPDEWLVNTMIFVFKYEVQV